MEAKEFDMTKYPPEVQKQAKLCCLIEEAIAEWGKSHEVADVIDALAVVISLQACEQDEPELALKSFIQATVRSFNTGQMLRLQEQEKQTTP